MVPIWRGKGDEEKDIRSQTIRTKQTIPCFLFFAFNYNRRSADRRNEPCNSVPVSSVFNKVIESCNVWSVCVRVCVNIPTRINRQCLLLVNSFSPSKRVGNQNHSHTDGSVSHRVIIFLQWCFVPTSSVFGFFFYSDRICGIGTKHRSDAPILQIRLETNSQSWRSRN